MQHHEVRIDLEDVAIPEYIRQGSRVHHFPSHHLPCSHLDIVFTLIRRYLLGLFEI